MLVWQSLKNQLKPLLLRYVVELLGIVMCTRVDCILCFFLCVHSLSSPHQPAFLALCACYDCANNNFMHAHAGSEGSKVELQPRSIPIDGWIVLDLSARF